MKHRPAAASRRRGATGAIQPVLAARGLPYTCRVSTLSRSLISLGGRAFSSRLVNGREVVHARFCWLRSAPLAIVLMLVAVLSFLDGGYILGSTGPFAVGFLALAGVWLALARPDPRAGWLVIASGGAFLAFALWSGLSIAWSVGPDLSWVSFNYALLYALIAVTVFLVRPGLAGLRLAAYGFLALAVAVAVYAFLGKALPDVVDHAHRHARLSDPLGYWNVLAVMLAMALPLALSLAARRILSALLRAAAAAAVALILATLFFTFSRGGFAAAFVILLVFFAAARERLGALITLIVAGLPVGLVLFRLRGLDTLFAPTDDAALRAAQGHALGRWSLLAFAIAFVLQLTVALVQKRVRSRPLLTRVVGWAVLICMVALLLGGPLMYMSRHGGVGPWLSARWSEFTSRGTDQSGDAVGRLTVVSSNGRVELYRIAAEGAAYHPVAGTGAGTFTFTNYRFRDTTLVVKHAHSQWMNVVSELGVAGLLLYAAAVLCLLAAALRSVIRWRRHGDRSLLAACLAAAVGFVAHMSVDWDWDMAAITAAFLLLGGSLAALRRPPAAATEVAAAGAEALPSNEADGSPEVRPGEDPPQGGDEQVSRRAPDEPDADEPPPPRQSQLPLPLAVLLAGVALLACISWLPPYLADRAHAIAVAQTAVRPAYAREQAERAHQLNPLAVHPLLTLAHVELRLGRPERALAALTQAARVQPQAYLVHYQLGLLLATAYARRDEAAAEFRRALSLNPGHQPSARQLAQLQGQ